MKKTLNNIPNILQPLFILLFIFISVFANSQITQVGTHTTASGSNVQSISIAKPTGVQVGDLLILNIIKYNASNTSDPFVNSDGTAGWTLLAGSGIGGSNNYRGAIMYKIVTELWEANSYTIVPSNWANGNNIQAAIVAYRGVDFDNPFNVTGPFISAGTTGSTIALPAISTTIANTLVVQLSMSWRTSGTARNYSSWSISNPGNLTEIYDIGNITSVKLGAATRIKASTGSTGNGTVTLSGANTYRGGIMLALNPLPPISVSATATETCVGSNTGTITVTASDGVSPYTYTLNGGAPQSNNVFENLAAGTYTVVGKDYIGREASTTIAVNTPSPSGDDQNAAGNNSWIGHVYDGINFDTYYGSYTEPALFNQDFGGANTCFPIISNSTSRSIYTETFSVRYRMNSSLRGLYAVDLGSDDGSRLTVDGSIVYNNWTDQAYTTKPRVLLSLTGSSNLMYEFYENGGGNQIAFENGVQIITNTLTTNLNQTLNQNSIGAAISGDVFGTLPVGITLSGTGYQWTYSTSPAGPRTVISGATSANYTPNSSTAPFNTSGTYYIFRNAILSSSNNVSTNPYISTNESNYAVLIVESKPFITANPTTLTGFTYAEGNGPSQEQSITIQGSNLTSNIIIYPPASFEISKISAGGFTSESPLTLNASGGAVANTTIYVRMKAGFPQGTVAPEFIQATANSADTVKISASGIVTTASVLTVGAVSGNFTYQFGAGPSAYKSFTVSGTNLQSNITITAPSDFQVSTTSGSGYSNSVTLNRVYNSGTGTYYLNSTTIYVRLIANLGVGTRTQDVQVSATAVTTENVSVTGIVTPLATILNPISLMGAFLYKQGSGPSGAQSFPVSGYNLSSGITITGTTNYEISLSRNSGFTNSITLPQSAGIVNATNIYVRLKAGISAQTLAIESILLTSTGATIKSIGCRGIVSPINTPTIAVSTPSLSGFGYQAAQGGPSPVQSFVVSGARLSTDIIINAPTNYEISNNPNSGFSSTYTVARTGDKVDPTTIYVRLVASKPAGDYISINITLNSTGATEQKIALAGKVFTSPLIQAGGGGGYCIGSSINLTSNDPDGSIQNLYWDGPNGYYSTIKNPTIPNANTNNSGDYTVNANVVIGGNLITNGDFELGNTSFGSAYEYPPLPLNTNSLQPEGRYAVVDLPSQVHTNFSSSAPDHTPSPGTKQMVINGNTTPGAVVWSQTVNVIPGSDYEFTYWLQTVVNGNDANPSKLQLYVNGVEAGPVYTANPTTGVWTQFVYNTKSGTSNILNLELINQNTIAGGNDFALDDIVFQQILTATSTVNVEVNNTLPVSVSVDASANPVNQGTTVTYTATPTNGGTTPTYQWLVNNQVVAGATSSTYSYAPNTGDQIKCVLTSSLQCVTNNPATSNTIAMTVNQNVNYWRGTNSTDWGTASNWTANFIPLAGDNVVYATVANYGSAAVRDLVLDQNRTIGSLINATNKRLVIPAAKSLTVNNTITVTPPVQNPAINLADLIYIHANSGLANGSLSFKNAQNNPVYASVEFYSKSSWDLSQPINQKYNWQYFGIPIDTVKASPTFDGAYVRQRNEAGTDTTTHWSELTNDSYLIPFKGYEICYQNPKTTLIQGKLINRDFNSGPLAKTSTSVVPDVLYPGQILLANPYTTAIDIRQITFGSDVLQTIYMYNTGTFKQWTIGNQGNKLGSQPGQYTAVPKNLAGSSGIPLQIPSMSSFLVFVSNATANAYVNLAYNSVIMGNTDQNRVKSIEKQQFVSTMVDVVGETGGDRMWLFTDKKCTRNFDNGYDARKLSTPALSPQIYAVEQDGNYQINTIDDLDNTTLAFQTGQDSKYTMTFTHENTDVLYQKITLYDIVNKTSTDITANGSTYTFTTETTPRPVNRFKLFVTKQNDDVTMSKINIFNLGNTLNVAYTGINQAEIYIFDIAGRKVAQSKIQPNAIETFEVQNQKVYIVKVISNDETHTQKVLIE